MEKKTARWGWVFLSILCAALDAAWMAWYCSGLLRCGVFLSVKSFPAEALIQEFGQNVLINFPPLCLLLLCALFYRRDCPNVLGLQIKSKKGRISVCILVVVYLALLPLGLFRGLFPALNMVYGWVYYFVFLAFAEELVFRAALPTFITKSNLSEKYVWGVPAVLFGMMHAVLPLVTRGLTAGVRALLFDTVGYALLGGVFYALYQWSGTLWMPILLHAALDYSAMLK